MNADDSLRFLHGRGISDEQITAAQAILDQVNAAADEAVAWGQHALVAEDPAEVHHAGQHIAEIATQYGPIPVRVADLIQILTARVVHQVVLNDRLRAAIDKHVEGRATGDQGHAQ